MTIHRLLSAPRVARAFAPPVRAVLVGALLALVGCGGGTSGRSYDDSESTTGAGTGGGGGGVVGCAGDGDCDDQQACTLDTCHEGTCSHTIGPNAGPTACPPGQVCTLKDGCIAAPACASDAQCVGVWLDDPCKSKIHCDPASSVCTFETLDKDGDGHPPQVCGGDDCDDGDPTRYPGAPEVCDGADNDCNGPVDDNATCPGLHVCQGGACVCPQEHACGGLCVDKSTDHDNCGSCGNSCGPGGLCTGGVCGCDGEKKMCSGVCKDTAVDPKNCGGCGNACAGGASCAGGKCACPGGQSECNGQCVDKKTDAKNCGACGTTCKLGHVCNNGACGCKAPLKECGGACIDTTSDESNCGGCGVVCSGGGTCIAGKCQGGVNYLGAACSANADCGNGLKCITSMTNDAILGGAPAAGYCSKTCSDSTDCPGAGSVCIKVNLNDPTGECFLGCTLGPAIQYINDPQPLDKCEGREDLRCADLGQGDAVCLPTCGSDIQCDVGKCDALFGVCRANPNQGKAAGQSCDPASQVPECAGVCIDFTVDPQNPLAECSQRCVMGGEDFLNQLDCGGITKGLCLFAPQGYGSGDEAFCANACKKQDDCPQFPSLPCMRVPGTEGVLDNGFCFGEPQPCTQAQEGKACLDPVTKQVLSTLCTNTTLGYLCVEPEWPLGKFTP